ncbi:MAG: DNA polymerase [Polyangiales bacterium]
MGFELVNGTDAASLLGLERPISGDVIAMPYPGSTYRRVRVLDPDANGGARYFATKGAPVEVYIPPGIEASTGALVIVESPPKALALVAAGIEAVGLGGIGTTLDAEHGLNASWDRLGVDGRTVVVLPDGNARTNPQVARDVARLCSALTAAGATTKLALLPRDAAKLGPDDFVVARGAGALRDIVAAAEPAGPAERLASAGEPSELLDDLVFLASAHLSSHGEKARIRRAAKATIGAGQLDAAVKDFAASLGEMKASSEGEAPEANTDDEFVIHEGGIVRVAADGQASYVVRGVVRIVTETHAVDDDRAPVEWELEAQLADGTILGRRRVPVSELHRAGALVALFGAQIRVDAAPHVVVAALQAISYGTVSRISVARNLGFVERNGQLGFVAANRAIGLPTVRPRVPDQLQSYTLPESVTDLDRALDVAMRAFELNPSGAYGAVYLGMAGLAVLSRFLGTNFALFFVSETGQVKSSTLFPLISHFGTFDRDRMPVTFESSLPAIEALVHAAGDVVVVLDDYAPRHPRDPVIEKAQKIFQNIGNRTGRAVLGKDRSLAEDRSPRGVVASSGEHAPEGASVNARLLTVNLDTFPVDLAVLGAMERRADELPTVGLALVEWVLVHHPDLRRVLRALRERYEAFYRDLPEVAHRRTPGQLALVLVGVHVYLEAMLVRGALDVDDAATAFRRAQQGIAELARAQAAKQLDSDPISAFGERLRDILNSEPERFPAVGDAHAKSDRILGYRDGTKLHLIPSDAYGYVAKHSVPYGMRSDLYRALIKRGIALPGEEGRYDRKVSLPHGRIRVVTVLIDKLSAQAPKVSTGPDLRFVEFSRLDAPRDPLALAAYAFTDGDGLVSMLDDRGISYANNHEEFSAWVAARDAFHGLVVWAPSSDRDVWTTVPAHALDVRAGLRMLGVDVTNIDAFRNPGEEPRRSDVEVLRDIVIQRQLELGRPELARLLEVDRAAAVVFRGAGDAGLPLDVEQAELRIAELEVQLASLASSDAVDDVGRQEELETVPNDEPTRHPAGVPLSRAAIDNRIRTLTELVSMQKDGRVRYRLDPHGTDTGRLKATPPCVLNLAKHGGVRDCIVAPPGHVILSADGASFEVVVLAALANDTRLLHDLAEGRDLYETLTDGATRGALHVPSGVSKRDVGKVLFKSLAKGQTVRGLSNSLGHIGWAVSIEDAAGLVRSMTVAFQGVTTFMDRVRSDDDVVRSRLGRKPREATLLSSASRQSFPVQSTGAEVFAAWVTRVMAVLGEYGVRLVLPLHDEQILEVPNGVVDLTQMVLESELREAFGDVFGTPIPARVRVKTGANFAFSDPPDAPRDLGVDAQPSVPPECPATEAGEDPDEGAPL